MADDSNNENGLPPKLDLRKKVITPLAARPAFPATVPNAGAAGRLASPSMPSPLGSGATAAAGGDSSKGTMRITLPDAPEPSVMPTMPTVMQPPADRPVNTPTPAVSSEATPSAASTAPGTAGPRPLMRPVMAPKTIKLKKPVPLGIKRDTPDPSAPPGTKRATSKISLPSDQDGQMASTTGSPQPIRIALPPAVPAVTIETVAKAGGNAGIATVTVSVPPPQPEPDPKRQTSRISLDSALGSEGESGPKTIKLKRPGSSTVRVQGLDSPEAGEPRNKTAAINMTDESSGDSTPDTQKKTIKVKRPSARPSLRTSAAEGTGGASSPTMFAPPTRKLAVDSAHWTFIVAGCAATIITGVLIYVLCAQAFGPNLSLTPLSYSGPDSATELPWPERIYRSPRK